MTSDTLRLDAIITAAIEAERQHDYEQDFGDGNPSTERLARAVREALTREGRIEDYDDYHALVIPLGDAS